VTALSVTLSHAVLRSCYCYTFMSYTVVCYTVLYCTVLYCCTVLYYTVVCCTVLYCLQRRKEEYWMRKYGRAAPQVPSNPGGGRLSGERSHSTLPPIGATINIGCVGPFKTLTKGVAIAGIEHGRTAFENTAVEASRHSQCACQSRSYVYVGATGISKSSCCALWPVSAQRAVLLVSGGKGAM
jgi:hypothetical protein